MLWTSWTQAKKDRHTVTEGNTRGRDFYMRLVPGFLESDFLIKYLSCQWQFSQLVRRSSPKSAWRVRAMRTSTVCKTSPPSPPFPALDSPRLGLSSHPTAFFSPSPRARCPLPLSIPLIHDPPLSPTFSAFVIVARACGPTYSTSPPLTARTSSRVHQLPPSRAHVIPRPALVPRLSPCRVPGTL